MTTIAEVYAMNVPTSVISERIVFVDIEPTKENIETERQNFLTWLNKRFEKFGRNFSSQKDAWESYDAKERKERELYKVMEHALKLKEDRDIPRWEDEIISILESLATSNVGNFDERGGQL